MINYESLTSFSQVVSKLSIFIFIIAANYVGDIFSCGVRNFMKEYMIFKHIIGLFIMIFFVGLIQDKLTIQERISQSFILYIWFIFIMRAPTIITITVIIIIAIIYIIDLYISDLKTKLEENKEINEKNSILIEQYTNVNNFLFIISFLMSIIGTSIYIYIIKRNLGNKFNIYTFLLGTRDQECFKKEAVKKFKNNPLFWDIQIARKGTKTI
tara:strand:+ start:17090 stop:17725 length:636 start_codon:yes stop_codon:yes gene_type:complete